MQPPNDVFDCPKSKKKEKKKRKKEEKKKGEWEMKKKSGENEWKSVAKMGPEQSGGGLNCTFERIKKRFRSRVREQGTGKKRVKVRADEGI